MFCIVETVEDDGEICCQAVPKLWIQGDSLYWPPESVLRKKGLQKQEPPSDSWHRFPFKMLKDNICNIEIYHSITQCMYSFTKKQAIC